MGRALGHPEPDVPPHRRAVRYRNLHIHKKLNKFMCQWFSCSCFFQSGACSHRHIKASWKPYVRELCSVCICYPTNPYSLHGRTLSDDRCVVCCEISWLSVYKPQHIIRRSGKMEEHAKGISVSVLKTVLLTCDPSFHLASTLLTAFMCTDFCVCVGPHLGFLLGNQRCTLSFHGARGWMSASIDDLGRGSSSDFV